MRIKAEIKKAERSGDHYKNVVPWNIIDSLLSLSGRKVDKANDKDECKERSESFFSQALSEKRNDNAV